MSDDGSSYGQYCPISRALDLLGERWSLLILRDMVLGATRFNDIARGLPGLSRSLLTKRLRQFERAGLVERLGSQYLMTEAGRDLRPLLMGLGEWGSRWAFGDPRPDELDAELLVWWMHERMDTSELPGRRHVFHLRFAGESREFWIVIEGDDPSVCLYDPGFDVDVTITSELDVLYEVWLGRRPLAGALREGTVAFEGPSAITRRMPTVLQLSPVAPIVSSVS